ncbi:MAG TPA: response regulator [Anaerolineales bacterium]|nr:response regulator [Anaerolineales bacterium]
MNANPGYLLIVEDDPDILRLLEATLTFKGYRVVTACNGREGLDAVRRERPALVIADIMMPKLDGFGLVHRLRISSETRGIPVIFITATYVAPEDKEFALNIGVTRFVQKPVDLDEFLALIAQLLEQGEAAKMEPLTEFNFYEGYRTRLEAKLAEIKRQIARQERLLETVSEDEHLSFQISIHHAVAERQEVRALLEQVYQHLAKFDKPA